MKRAVRVVVPFQSGQKNPHLRQLYPAPRGGAIEHLQVRRSTVSREHPQSADGQCMVRVRRALAASARESVRGTKAVARRQEALPERLETIDRRNAAKTIGDNDRLPACMAASTAAMCDLCAPEPRNCIGQVCGEGGGSNADRWPDERAARLPTRRTRRTFDELPTAENVLEVGDMQLYRSK
jgi:hypothetical protein